MINFVEIPLMDPSYMPQHDQLGRMLSEGWSIIGHAVYADNHDGEPFERYTLYRKETCPDLLVELAERGES